MPQNMRLRLESGSLNDVKDAEIDNGQLDHQRSGTEDRDIGAGQPVDETVLAQTHQGQQQGWDHSQQHRHNGQSQSVQNAVYKVGGVLGQEGEIDEAGWECGIKHF